MKGLMLKRWINVRKFIFWPIKALSGVLTYTGVFMFIAYLLLIGRSLDSIDKQMDKILEATKDLK